ncbi:hypothetical protein ACWGEU_31105, partial [Streptomyces goshikiensis]
CLKYTVALVCGPRRPPSGAPPTALSPPGHQGLPPRTCPFSGPLITEEAYDKEPTGFRIKPLSVEHLNRLSDELTERMLRWSLRAMVLKDPDLPNKIPPCVTRR